MFGLERFTTVSGLVRGLNVVFTRLNKTIKELSDTLEKIPEIQEEIDVLNGEVEQIKVDITKLSKRYVVTTYNSGNDWYEVYNDGWVRQGQFYHQAGATTYSRTFLVTMDGSRYSLKTSPHMSATSQLQYRSFGYSFTSSGFSAYVGTATDFISWQLDGWGDSAAVTALGASPNY